MNKEIEQIEKSYDEVRAKLDERASDSEQALYFLDIEEIINETQHSKVLDVLISVHGHLMFYRNEKTISCLTRFGLKDLQTRWFISMLEIDKAIESICKKGIHVNKLVVLISIQEYLFLKFYKDLQFHSNFFYKTKKRITPVLAKILKDLKRRQKYRNYNLNASNNEIDKGLLLFINKMGIENLNKETIDIAVKYATGNIEGILLAPMLENGFVYNKNEISQTKFFSAIYDLFRIFLVEYNLEDEAAFDLKDCSALTFDIFKAYKLRKIIYRK